MFSVSGVLKRSGGRALAISFLVTAVLVTAVAAKDQKPFSGSVNETFTAGYCPAPDQGLICAQSSGSGNITYVGKVTSSFLGKIDPSVLFVYGCAPVASTGTLTAPNGDRLDVLDSGRICLLTATTAMVSGDFTITGGTGRFTGASGAGHYDAPTDFPNGLSGGSSAEVYNGSIALP